MTVRVEDIRQGQTLYYAHAIGRLMKNGEIHMDTFLQTIRVSRRPYICPIVLSYVIEAESNSVISGGRRTETHYYNDRTSGLKKLFRSKGKAQRYLDRVKAQCLSAEERLTMERDYLYYPDDREDIFEIFDAARDDYYDDLAGSEEISASYTQFAEGDQARYIDGYGPRVKSKRKTFTVVKVDDLHRNNQRVFLSEDPTNWVSNGVLRKVQPKVQPKTRKKADAQAVTA